MKKSYIVLSPLIALSFLMCSSTTLTNPTGGGEKFNTLENTSNLVTNEEEVFWENDGTRGDPTWTSIYRFCTEGQETGETTDIIPLSFWERMKTETFYLDFTLVGTEYSLTMAVGTGWYDHYTGDDITIYSPLIEKLSDNNYRLTIALATDPIVTLIDERNFLLSGMGYIPQRLFFKTGHTCDLMLVNGKSPTLLDPGYKSYYTCKICGKCYEDSEGLILIENIESWKLNEGKINPILPISWFIAIVGSLFIVLICVTFIIIYKRNGFAKLDISNVTYTKKHSNKPLLDEYVVSFDWRGYRLHYSIFIEKRKNATIEDIKKEIQECVKLLAAIGYNTAQYNDYTVVISTRRTKNLGRCTQKGSNRYEISFNDKYIKFASSEHIHDVIMHEILHSLPGCMDHGTRWKTAAAKVMNNYTYSNISRLAHDDNYSKYIQPYKEKYKYEEERRLFYVALTRSKKQTLLLGVISIGALMSATGCSTKTYTVTFETNGGTVVEAQQVKSQATVTEPKKPTKRPYSFGGWYADEKLEVEYDFSKPVTNNLKLYAKWTDAVSFTYSYYR